MCFTRIYGFIFCDPKVINSRFHLGHIWYHGTDYGINTQCVSFGSKTDGTMTDNHSNAQIQYYTLPTQYNDRKEFGVSFASNWSSNPTGNATTPDPVIGFTWMNRGDDDIGDVSYNSALPATQIRSTFSSITIGQLTTSAKTVAANSYQEWNETIPRYNGEKVIPIFVGEYRSGKAGIFKIKQIDLSGLSGNIIFDYYNLTSAAFENARPVIYYIRISHPIPQNVQSYFPDFVV